MLSVAPISPPLASQSELEPPVGVVPNTPALRPPRPALKVLHDSVSQPPTAQDPRLSAQPLGAQRLGTQQLGAQLLGAQLLSGRELSRRRRQLADSQPLPSAEPQLDQLLGGGLARRTLVELVGRRSSGRFSLVATLLAAVTRTGEAAALIDLGDNLDPQAAHGLGVDLERLLWLRPRRLREALAATEIVLAGGFPCVVLDLGLPPLAGRVPESSWLRLARAAMEHEAAVLVSTPYRVSGPAATTVLATDRRRSCWQSTGQSPLLLAGLASQLSIEKKRGGAPGAQGEIGWRTSPLVARDQAATAAPAQRRSEAPALLRKTG